MNRNSAEKQNRQVLKHWQKQGLRLCLFSLLISAALQGFRMYRRGLLTDQNEAARWAPEGGYAQVSVFFAEGAAVTQDNLKELAYDIREGLAEDSVGRTEDEKGQDCLDAFSTSGALTVEHGGISLDLDAVGIGGNFFSFHPLELVSGDYFDSDDLMKDRILIDEDTAWKLFGSSDVVGQSVLIGDMYHYIAGVYRREESRFYATAGLDRSTIFVAYKTMLQYGTDKTYTGSESSEEMTANGLISHSGQDVPGTGTAQLRPEEDGRNTNTDAGPAGLDRSPEMREADDGIRTGNAGYLPAVAGDDAFTGSYSVPGPDGPSEPGGDGPGDLSPGGFGDDGPGGLYPGFEEGPGTDDEEADPFAVDTDEDTEENTADEGGLTDSGTETEAAESDSESAATENGAAALPEGTGTQNTAFTDNGKVLCYEIVLPDPVDGYAEKLVKSKIGLDESAYAVVENTGRYDGLSLSEGWLKFWTRSMRVGSVSYPFWENAARGWEEILSLLFLFQCLLTALPALYVLYLILYYFTHKQWTLLGLIREMQDRAYEREAARRYPELVKQLEAERRTLKGEAV